MSQITVKDATEGSIIVIQELRLWWSEFVVGVETRALISVIQRSLTPPDLVCVWSLRKLKMSLRFLT